MALCYLRSLGLYCKGFLQVTEARYRWQHLQIEIDSQVTGLLFLAIMLNGVFICIYLFEMLLLLNINFPGLPVTVPISFTDLCKVSLPTSLSLSDPFCLFQNPLAPQKPPETMCMRFISVSTLEYKLYTETALSFSCSKSQSWSFRTATIVLHWQ